MNLSGAGIDPARLNPLAVQREDNPESVRLRKYLTGSNLLLHLVDIDTGCTPKKLVWTRDKVRLYRCEITGQKRYRTPVLMAYALILRPYILDLTLRNSMVRHLVEQGFDVFLLDFGLPEESDADLPLEVYVGDYLGNAVEEVAGESGSEDITIIGHCMGGTLAAIYAASRQPTLTEEPGPASDTDRLHSRPSGLTGLWTLLTRQPAFRLDDVMQYVVLNPWREVFLLGAAWA